MRISLIGFGKLVLVLLNRRAVDMQGSLEADWTGFLHVGTRREYPVGQRAGGGRGDVESHGYRLHR